MDKTRLYVDFHVLQTVPPSCVNRDDTGSPKTALYGGATRSPRLIPGMETGNADRIFRWVAISGTNGKTDEENCRHGSRADRHSGAGDGCPKTG